MDIVIFDSEIPIQAVETTDDIETETTSHNSY